MRPYNATRSDPRATVKFHDSKITKRLNQCGLFGKPPLSKNSMAKLHLNVPQDIRNDIIWTDKTMYGTTFHLITVVKHGGGEVMSWAPHGHWPDLCIASVYNSRVKYEAIYLAANSWLKLGHAKAHAISSTSEWLEKERTKVLQCISQSPALSLIEYLNVIVRNLRGAMWSLTKKSKSCTYPDQSCYKLCWQ